MIQTDLQEHLDYLAWSIFRLARPLPYHYTVRVIGGLCAGRLRECRTNTTQSHRQRQHGRRDQQRNALGHKVPHKVPSASSLHLQVYLLSTA
jgi:hypothetical protein